MCICNATQRNATQRIPQLYLNNNFKFYIFQFFRAFNFLSVSFLSFIKEKQNLCSFFYREKRTTPKADSRQKAPSFVKRSKTTPFRIRNSLVKTMSLQVKQSNLNLIKFDFYNLVSLINKFYTKWIASGDAFAMTIKNKFAILNNNVAFASACRWQAHCVIQGVSQRDAEAKTPCCSGYAFPFDAFKFEIISQLNYGFCYKNYFFNLNQVFRNSYDFGERFGRNLNYDFEKNCNGDFGKNYFGDCNFGFDFGNEICSIGNNLAGFLFNRKTKKINLCQRYSVGEGEQK